MTLERPRVCPRLPNLRLAQRAGDPTGTGMGMTRHLPRIILAALALAFATLVGLALLRALDNRHLETKWRALDGRPGDEVFEPAQIARLPAPAQRYFRWT